MDDDSEDFQQLFFAECNENIEVLQARLDDLLLGSSDPEVVHAAFRAVHSIKGGAAAFGFGALVNFAHELETLLDRLRSGAVALSAEVAKTLLRATDIMIGLVEAIHDGSPGPVVRAGEIIRQIRVCARTGDAPDPAVPPVTPPAPAPAVAAPSAVVEVEQDEGPETATVHLIAGPDFLIAGFEPLRLIRAARGHGLLSVAVENDVPEIADYKVGECPLVWRLEFEVIESRGALEDFLETYAYCAEIVITYSGSEEGPAAPADALASVVLPEEPAPAAPIAVAKPPALPPVAVTPPDPAPAPLSLHDPEPPVAGKGMPPRTLRVDLTRVDRLVNLVGEVLIAQAAVSQNVPGGNPTLDTLLETLNRQTRELQESVMAIRAQPVRAAFARMPRLVRDLCDLLGKDVRLVTIGEDVEVDTTVIMELSEPLMHMVRNAMDHGIETPEERRAVGKPPVGTLTLKAEQRAGRVHITLTDDGRGIDHQAVLAKARQRGLIAPDETPDVATIEAQIFQPGFSTAPELSSVSGRGVGMDVVRRKIIELGGRCTLGSTPGQGTCFTIVLPLTLAIMDGMAVRIADQQYILPLSNVVEAISITPNAVSELPDRMQVIRVRDDYLPVFSLREKLGLPETRPGLGGALVVDTETDGLVVVLVDDLIGQRQIVLKTLDENVGRVTGVGGATILGDGHVALILDVSALLDLGDAGGRLFEGVH